MTYDEINSRREQSVGQSLLKTGGSMLAYMALNMAFSTAGNALMKGGTKLGIDLLKKASVSKSAAVPAMIRGASESISKLTSTSTLSETAKAIGFTLPGSKSPVVGKVVDFAKNQITSVASSMVVQNINAISDGRKLTPLQLLKESIVADVAFRGVGALGGKTLTSIKNSKFAQTTGKKAYEKLSEKVLQPLDLHVSTFVTSYRKHSDTFVINNNTLANKISNAVGPKGTIRRVASGAMALGDMATLNTDAKKLELLGEKFGVMGENITKKVKATESVKSVLRDAGFVRARYELLDNGAWKDNAYESAGAAITHVTQSAASMLKLANVPIVNTLFVNKLMENSWETQSNISVRKAMGKDMPLLYQSGAKKLDVGDDSDVADHIRRFFGFEKNQVLTKNQRDTLDLTLSSNLDNKFLDKGVVAIPMDHSVVTTGSGTFLIDQKNAITPINSLAFATQNEKELSSFIVSANLQGASRGAEFLSDVTYGSHAKGNEQTVGISAIKIESKSTATQILENREILKNATDSDLNAYAKMIRRDSDRHNVGDAIQLMEIESGRKWVDDNTLAFSKIDIENQKQIGSLMEVFKDDPAKAGQIRHVLYNDSNVVKYGDSSMSKFDYVRSQVALKQAEINGLPDTVLPELRDYFIEREYIRTMGRDGRSLKTILDNIDNSGKISVSTFTPYIDIEIQMSDQLKITREIAQNKSISDSIIQNFGSIVGQSELELSNYTERIVDNTVFNAAIGISTYDSGTGKRTIDALGLDKFKDVNSNLTNIGDVIGYSAMMSVNDLANNFGLGIKPTRGHNVPTFAMDLMMTAGIKLGALGVGFTALNAVATSGFFDGTRLENGIMPFMSETYSDFAMAGKTIAHYTGIEQTLGAINQVIPGIISSPLGGFITSVSPVLAGYTIGNKVAPGPIGSIGGISAGLAVSGILGGFGGSILGSYDVTQDLGESYAIASGEESVGIRKGRFWGLSSGSFWGKNTSYYRNNAILNTALDPTATGDIYGDYQEQTMSQLGLSDPSSRRRYSRPYVAKGGGYEGYAGAGTTTYGIGSGEALTSTSVVSQTNQLEELYGLRGFVAKSAVQSALNPDMYSKDLPTIASPNEGYGLGRQFYNQNLGGFFGQTEYIRRILPANKNTNTINPVRNLMPGWLPGSNYMINFKEGDPYTKVTEGEIRLPGSGNVASNPVNLDMPYDLEIMGYMNDEDVIKSAVYGKVESQDDNIRSNEMKEQYIQMFREISQSEGTFLTENSAYYAGNNIIATADLDYKGTSTKVEVISNKEFSDVKGNSDNIYKRKADLLATISKKNSQMVIINRETGEQITLTGLPNDKLLQEEVSRISKLKPKIVQKIKEKGLGINNLYSIVDRFKVLADVAPYSKEYRQYEKIVKTMAKRGELSDREVKAVAKAMEKKEIVTGGQYTANTKGSPLHNWLPGKLLAPDQLDPLITYQEEQIYSSGMKRWENPLSYLTDDYALTASGKFNPVKRAIGSGLTYGFMFGYAQGGIVAAQATLLRGAAANLGFDEQKRETYDQSRDILLKQQALEYQRNIVLDRQSMNRNNLYASIVEGGRDPDSVTGGLTRDDRVFYDRFKNITDKEEQEKILQTVSPQMQHLLAAQYEMDYNIQGLDQSEFLNSIDDDSILYDRGVDTDYMVIRQLKEAGIDPRTIGKGFSQEERSRRNSVYGELSFGDHDIKSDNMKIEKMLSQKLNAKVSIEGYNIQDDRNMEVIVIHG